MAEEDDDKPTLVERFEEMKDSLSDEESNFNNIPEAERLHPSKKLCGMLKLASLMHDPAEFDLHGEHGEVSFLSDESDYKPMTDNDIRYLVRCGFRPGEYDSLAMYANM